MTNWRAYYRLAKPGIVYGNALSAIAGFLLASYGHPYLPTFIGMLVGVSFVMASACVFNNYLDRDIDDLMARTKGRALVTGEIPPHNALAYGTALLFTGVGLLVTLTNPLTALVAVFGHVAYVFMYGLAKRKTVHGTVIGSISGAVPPVVGYVAVTNQLDVLAGLLFLALVFWQMPHFYAIAVFRLRDYQNAGIPVLPAVRGIVRTKIEISWYVVAFIVTVSLMTILGYTGYTFLVVMLALSTHWLYLTTHRSMSDDALWARRIFKFSLWILLAFCVLASLDAYLP